MALIGEQQPGGQGRVKVEKPEIQTMFADVVCPSVWSSSVRSFGGGAAESSYATTLKLPKETAKELNAWWQLCVKPATSGTMLMRGLS